MFKRYKANKSIGTHTDTSSFWVSFALNLVLNYEFLVVAIALLILHFVLGVPKFLFWLCLGIWILPNLLFSLLLFFLAGMDSGQVDEKENKNPYSVGQKLPQSPENKNPYSKGRQ